MASDLKEKKMQAGKTAPKPGAKNIRPEVVELMHAVMADNKLALRKLAKY